MHHANKALIPALQLRIFGIGVILGDFFVGLPTLQQTIQRILGLF